MKAQKCNAGELSLARIQYKDAKQATTLYFRRVAVCLAAPVAKKSRITNIQTSFVHDSLQGNSLTSAAEGRERRQCGEF